MRVLHVAAMGLLLHLAEGPLACLPPTPCQWVVWPMPLPVWLVPLWVWRLLCCPLGCPGALCPGLVCQWL